MGEDFAADVGDEVVLEHHSRSMRRKWADAKPAAAQFHVNSAAWGLCGTRGDLRAEKALGDCEPL
jgi:hypothetical protein